MPWIKVNTDGHTIGTGFSLGSKAYQDKHGRPVNHIGLPKVGSITLADGSTPSPNLRASEILISLLTLAKTSPLLRIVTFVGCGGTKEKHLGARLFFAHAGSKYWRDFYAETKIMDRVPLKYSPISWYAYIVVFLRKLLVTLLWIPLTFRYPLRTLTVLLTFSVGTLEARFRKLKLADVIGLVKSRQAIIQIPCPVCSYQQKKSVYHVITSGYRMLTIMKDVMSTAEAKCNAAAILREKMNNLTLWDLTFRLGGKLSGSMVYALLGLEQKNLAIRDYSERGQTVANLVKMWGRNIWITTRFYIYFGNIKVENTFVLILSLIFLLPFWIINVFNKFDVLSNGDEISVHL